MPATDSSPIDRDRRVAVSRLATPAKAAVRLALLPITWLPLSALALDLEVPDVGLAGVPLDYRASGAEAGAGLILSIAGARHVATADAEGAATFVGVVWGDHCSPISDTTVLSSVASGCDHIEHVRTQLPYALLVGVVGLLVGTIPAGFGVPPWLSVLVGIVVLGTLLRVFGRRAGVR